MRKRPSRGECTDDRSHVLKSGRLVLRQVLPTDGPSLLSSFDDEVRMAQGYDDAAVAAMVQSVDSLASFNYGGCPLSFAVSRSGSSDVLGFYVIQQDPQDADVPSLGWWLKAAGRGEGLGRESLALVLGYVHEHLRFSLVTMTTTADNSRARAQIEAIGGYVATRLQRQLPDGSTVAAVCYEHEL